MKRARRSDAALGAAGVVLVVLAWELFALSGAVSPAVFPAPTAALARAFDRLTLAEVTTDVAISMFRIVAGFSLAALAGVAIAVLAAWYRGFGRIVRPIVELLRPIPPLAWIPMAIVWFGLGEPSKIFVIFLGAFFPVLTNAYRGMASVDPILLRAAQTMDVTGPRLLTSVMLPAALPDIATGLRVGWGLSFGVLVAAELIAADSGVGWLITNARQIGEVGIVIFGILLIGGLNITTDFLLAALIRRRLGQWHAV